MHIHLVIAHYQEDLLWLDALLKSNSNLTYTIYSKGDSCMLPHIKLENRGRESDTFLRYIIDNYNNLPDLVAFLQGKPHASLEGELATALSNYDNEKAYPLSQGVFPSCVNRCDWVDMPLKEFATRLFTNHSFDFNKQYLFLGGAEYLVRKEVLLRKSLEWWKHTLKLHDEYLNYPGWQTGSPWMMERLWPLIWRYTDK